MNAIAEEAVVSCYVNAVSALAMIVLLMFLAQFRLRKKMSMRIFRALCLYITTNSVLGFLCNAMYGQTAPWCHIAAFAAKTLQEAVVMLTVGLWIVFVYYRLYGRKKSIGRMALRLACIPFAVLLTLLIVNLFTGIYFTCTPENKFESGPWLPITYAAEFFYFCSSVVMVRYYDRKALKIRLLRISPMLVPVALVSGAQFFTPYDIGILGQVTGISLLYLSVLREYRFVDEESGLYNRNCLSYLIDLAMAGKNDTHSALVLEMDGELHESFRILRDTLHREGDVIRVEKNKFLMFSRMESRPELQLLSTQVEEAVAKHNAEHPEEEILMTAHCHMRPMGEDSYAFIRTVMEGKETGDEVRGVVSMISELNRLDEELKLAADIQLNMLPMNFPPFPERTEFDLYASMTPAKEVGGDFYDFFLIDSDHLAVVIADVSGKGIPAALFMMVSKTLIKNQLMTGCDPATALERVNLQLCERNTSMMFVTIWVAVLEISTGRGMACNAGHENPGIRRADGDFELLRYKHDIFIGVRKKAKFRIREFELHPGDCVFVYTDGVPEATRADRQMFGEQRLVTTLNQDAGAGPEELVHRVHREVDCFVKGAPQFDDITMLCLKYNGIPDLEEV